MTDLIIIKYSEIADRPNTSEDPLIPKEFQEFLWNSINS